MIAKRSVRQKGLAYSRGRAQKPDSLAVGADSRSKSVNPLSIGQGHPSGKPSPRQYRAAVSFPKIVGSESVIKAGASGMQKSLEPIEL